MTTTPRRGWARSLREVLGLEPWSDGEPAAMRAHRDWWRYLSTLAPPPGAGRADLRARCQGPG